MRKTHTFEIVGIGEFNEYPIKVKDKDYPIVSKDGKPLVKKVIQTGITGQYGFMDSDGKIYEKEEVFYNLNGKLVQKVEKTKQVSKFDVVSKDEVYNLLESDTSVLMASNKTTLETLKSKLGNDKVLRITYKKSSVGFRFVKAYIYLEDNEVMMVTGLGSKKDALENFKMLKSQMDKGKEESEVVVSAEDIDIKLD